MLTDWHRRVAVYTGESVPAPAAVRAVEVPGAAARTGEEAKRPALSVVLARVRILGPVRTRVGPYGHALASAEARAAGVVSATQRGRTAAPAAQNLGARALTRELRARNEGATGQHYSGVDPHGHKIN